MAREVILWLDIAQENRCLSLHEQALRVALKKRVMGLAVIKRSRKRHNSRITNLREGDANTKFFHLKVNSRKRRNHIQRLQKEHGWAMSHEEKQEAIRQHFQDMMSLPNTRTLDLRWDAMDFTTQDLHSLEDTFTEQEVT